MSAGTDLGARDSSELPGIHDRLRRAYEAALDERWEDYDELVLGARSEGLKRQAQLARRGGDDV